MRNKASDAITDLIMELLGHLLRVIFGGRN